MRYSSKGPMCLAIVMSLIFAFAVCADARGGFHGGGGGGARGGGFSGGGRGASTSIQRPSGGNFNGNRNFNGTTNVNRNTNFNRNTNINANVNRNVNVDVDNHWNGGSCYGGCRHPIAAGVAIGTAAAVTAAAIGSMVYSLPPACVTRAYPSGTYYSCGDVWYQPQYAGTSVTYVVVNNPG